MTGYQPLDLSALCNAGQAVLGQPTPTAVGPQHFHGLPFLIGGQGDKHFIALKSGDAPVTIPIGAPAYHVLFVQRLLAFDADTGGQPGQVVAEYRVRYADGTETVVPIRERYEVQAVPVPWGQVAYRAMPDQKNALMPRYEGRWDMMGERQTEGGLLGGRARDYYVWAWPNPHPDRPIASVTVTPCGAPFLIAAVTLSHVNEYPFARQGRRETRITLTDAADAAKRFDLDVEVDRGVATYVHPLPQADAAAFIGDPFKGWGQAQNEQSSPAYVEIAATPSATVTVKQGNETVGQVRWGDVETKGVVETPRLRVELLDRGKNWVHVTVVDDATGQPLPCRVHFRSPEGIPYQPHGNHNQVNSNLGSWHSDVGGDLRLGQTTYAYIDGTCQGWLPRGEVVVDVARGYEYEPLRTTVTIQPGQRELTLRLKRWTDMNAQGWYSGDSHVHFLSANGSHTEALGEGLNVVNLLQSQWGSLFTNTEEYAGKPGISQRGNSIVYCSQENRQHFLGHLTLWGLKEPVMPWCSDGPGEAEMGGTLEVTMSDWADRCHAQGGTVILPHLPMPNGEPATLIATGRVDAVEMIWHTAFAHYEYYRYLNAGYRLPLVGGTDKMYSDVPVGLYRTYAHLSNDRAFTYDAWTEAVRHGRTFLSGGPLLRFTVEGREVGDTLMLSGPGTVEVEAEAESTLPIYTLQIVQQGRVVAATEEAKGARRLALRAKVKVNGHSWLAARCGGPDYATVPHHDVWHRGVFAHTSPIYVACGGEWWLFDKDMAQYMLTLIDGCLTYIRENASLHTHGTVTHHHGEDDHHAYLERPFCQAQDAIHRRMHQLGIPH